jgi:multidrug efflux system membrane fusion protein
MAARVFSIKWLLLAAALGSAAFLLPRLQGGTPPEGADMAAMMGGPPPVSVATVVMRPVIEWREFSGMFEAVNAVEVRPRVGGQITAIHFADGAEVKKGQALFTIDPRPYEAALIGAKGTLAEAQSTLARAKKLIGSKAISRAELDAAQSAYDRALGNYKAAEVNLDYTRITAPIAGKISRAEITVGNLVDPAAAPLLASIIDLSPIYASFTVDEATYLASIQGVSAGKLKTIPVEVGLGNEKSAGVKAAIHSFDNQITPGSGTIRVRALVENADKTIVPGLYARVRLGAADAADAVLIHPSAVNTDQAKKFVLVVGADNKTEYRPVTLGGMDGALQVVREGLKPGEQVVVSGLQRAQPGAPVQPNMVDMETLKPLNPPVSADAAAVAETPTAE